MKRDGQAFCIETYHCRRVTPVGAGLPVRIRAMDENRGRDKGVEHGVLQ
jgi:hypothetical protein